MKLSGFRILIAAAAVFFVITAALGTPPPGVWNSPDEAANAFWSERISNGESLTVSDAIVGLGRGAIHPRSFAVRGDALVPGSFPGIFLIFGAARSFSGIPLAWLTPLFTALAGVLFYLTVKKIFSERVGFWSAILFYGHPAVIYYSARGLFHNLLFLDLLIAAAFCLIVRPISSLKERLSILDGLIAGFVLGLALITRMSEAPWVLTLAVGILIWRLWSVRGQRSEVRGRSFLILLLGLAAPLFIFGYLNSGLYGAPLKTAYESPAAPSEAVSAAAPEPGSLLLPESSDVKGQMSKVKSLLLPFGFHPRLMVWQGFDYGLKFFWWFTVLAVIGLFGFFINRRAATSERKIWLAGAIGVAVWLVTVYGSWYFRDNLDPTKITIGTSYVRYFLPAYAAFLPFVAGGLVWLSDRWPRRKHLIAFALGAILIALSFRTAVCLGDEGLLSVREVLKINAIKKQVLLGVIPPEAVIMTRRFDKVVFPERLRIIPLEDATAFETAAAALKLVPVYYYGLDPSPEELTRLQEAAEAAGLVLREIGHPVAGETLYALEELVP